MNLLIISGMDKNHDNEHVKSNSSYQYSFFEEIIKKQNPLSNISVYKPYIEDVNKFFLFL